MKLISLNIETNKHLDMVVPFLQQEDADALCLMEVMEDFLPRLESLGYYTYFLPMGIRADILDLMEGICIASKIPPTNTKQTYYYQPPGGLTVYENDKKRETLCKGYAIAELGDFRICATHFTWTPNGEHPNKHQLEDLPAMMTLLAEEAPHILCGDMNIPRDINPLYEELTKYYTDTIPAEYTSSLDKTIHRHGSNPEKDHLFTDFMVDYIFTQPPYQANNVRLEFGVSDHAAVVAEITKG